MNAAARPRRGIRKAVGTCAGYRRGTAVEDRGTVSCTRVRVGKLSACCARRAAPARIVPDGR